MNRTELMSCAAGGLGQVRKSVATTTSAAASGISGMIHKGMKKLSKVFSGTKLDKLGRAPVGLDVKGLCRENVHFLKELGHGMTSVRGSARIQTDPYPRPERRGCAGTLVSALQVQLTRPLMPCAHPSVC
jgi:hypothetical protein